MQRTAIIGAAISVALLTVLPAAAQTFRTYACADGSQFVAAFYPSDPKRAHLQIDGKAVALKRGVALSGSRYRGGGIALRITKAGVTVKRGNHPASACSQQS
jgi:membrane-bound inhibitor of C-type lysozyme